ncbi:MAG: sulfite exporter TauE/SafE family protein [Flavipsychrobacter sp.]
MSTGYIIGVLLIGLAAGFLSSMAGVGGGIVIVPALVFLFGFNQKMAQGTSFAMLALPVAFIGAFNYYKAGEVNWKIALMLASTFVIGGFFGSKVALGISPAVLKKFFGILLMVIALKYLFFDK